MTACVDNKEKKGGAAKAVSATLAGVLAVGMVPAVAFATPEDGSEAEGGDEISLLSSDLAYYWINGNVTKAVDQDGDEIAVGTEFSANGSVQVAIPTEYTPFGDANPVKLFDEDGKLKAGFQLDFCTAHYDATGKLVGDGAVHTITSGVTVADIVNQLKTSTNADIQTTLGSGAPGVYYVDVYNNNAGYSYTDGEGNPLYPVNKFVIKINAASLADAKVFVNGDVTNTTPVYNGLPFQFSETDLADTNELGLTINGIALEYGKHYEVKDITPVGGTATNPGTGAQVLNEGTYSVTYVGKGAYADGKEYTANLTIGTLDLETATIVAGKGNCIVNTKSLLEAENLGEITINGVPATKVLGKNGKASVTVTYVDDNKDLGKWDPDPAGAYAEYTLSVGDSQTSDANVTGSKEITVVAAKEVANIGYQGNSGTFWFSARNTQANAYVVDLEQDQEFDQDKIIVKYGAGNANQLTKNYSVKYYTAAGVETDLDTMNSTPGWYQVNVVVDHGALGYALAGNETMWVHVINGTIDATKNVFVTYEGQPVENNAFSDEYDGTDVLDDTVVTVTNADGDVLTAGEDYEITYVRFLGDNSSLTVTDQMSVVDEMINAGRYGIVVSELGYDIANGNDGVYDVVYVTINPMELDNTEIRVANETVVRDGSKVIKATGSAITPVLEYNTHVKNANGYEIWAELPADTYEVATLQKWNADYAGGGRWEDVDAIIGQGFYNIGIEDIDDGTVADTNYAILDGFVTDAHAFTYIDTDKTTKPYNYGYDNGYFYVTEESIFADVPEGEWYSDYVYDAAAEGYMGGYDGTDLFGPHNFIMRGEAATVLFRMAGGELNGSISEDILKNPILFDDVDYGMYYTAPVIWANTAGIITGYLAGENEGDFVPTGNITREEFALMLYRYAYATNQLGDTEAGDLSQFSDGNLTSDWAREALEWCVGAGIMSGYDGTDILSPGGTITRAEAAKMIMTFQPDTLNGYFTPNGSDPVQP